MGSCDPGILETSIYALTLLGRLAESGLTFLFKGGTSLLLHLGETRRLSRDIDIVCSEPRAAVDAALAEIGRIPPFMGCTEDERGDRGLPRRRHFKFSYTSAVGGRNPVQYVLLDVVEEGRQAHVIMERPIRTSFLEPERDVRVRVPTIESLLGDKLTAFAPATVGVPLRKPDRTPADVQQVAKQLFDIGMLFEASSDFSVVEKTYGAVHGLESGYRGNRYSIEDSLDDTMKACLAITATRPDVVKGYPDASLLHDGFDRLRGHVTWPAFNRGREFRRTVAARAAVLASHLRAHRPFDFARSRFTGSPEQLAALRAGSLNGTPHAWIDRVKAVNPEAYHYWLLALTLS
jgi:hypothetical protein